MSFCCQLINDEFMNISDKKCIDLVGINLRPLQCIMWHFNVCIGKPDQLLFWAGIVRNWFVCKPTDDPFMFPYIMQEIFSSIFLSCVSRKFYLVDLSIVEDDKDPDIWNFPRHTDKTTSDFSFLRLHQKSNHCPWKFFMSIINDEKIFNSSHTFT